MAPIKEGTAFVALLRACARDKDLHRGTRVHEDILKKGLLGKCSDALVAMYAKCGALSKARELIDVCKSKDVYSWTALMVGYVQKGRAQDAISCFERMKHEGLSPDSVTFACILKACASIQAADKGGQIHEEIAKRGLLHGDVVLGNALIDMYAKCGALEKAEEVLNELPLRDVVSWNSLITGYAQEGQGEQALACYERMCADGIAPNEVTFMCVLKACGGIGAIGKGVQIHNDISSQGLLGDQLTLGNALVDMYAKCGALVKAKRVLDELPVHDVISWNTLMVGYNQQAQGEEALDCYELMQQEGLSADAVTFSCILKAYGSLGSSEKGKEIHDEIARQGFLDSNIAIGTALVDMYAKCGDLEKAQQVLEKLPVWDVVSWSALITGYAQQGKCGQALSCFDSMQRVGLGPDAMTFACALEACGCTKALEKGGQIHDEIAKQGILGNDIVLGNALVDMYAKCGALAKAQQVLEELPVRDVISWSALIAGYVEDCQSEQALNCYGQMQGEGCSPNAVTLLCLLKACGDMGAIDKGEQLHDHVIRQGLLEESIELGTALVDMHVKCGALAKASKLLEGLPCRDITSWNSLITGYAQQGHGRRALDCFECMLGKGFHPDAVTFSCVLAACCHLGQVDEARLHFDSMSAKFGMEPSLEHFTCMIDLLGRHGQLDEAVGVIQKMPSCNCSRAVWSALLGACQKWGNVNVGRWAFDQAMKADKSDGSAYVLMANIYGAAGMHDDAEMIEILRKEQKVTNLVCIDMTRGII